LEDGVNLRLIQSWLGRNSPAVTVPESLRGPVRSHPRDLLPLLFDAAASTLLDVCRNPKFLGAMPALTAVLHTWTRQLLYHPHIHFLASGGGLEAGGAWRAAPVNFLVPVHALSTLFRARLRDELCRHHPERQALRLLQAQLALTHALPLPPTEKPVRVPLPPPACPNCASPMSSDRFPVHTLPTHPTDNARGPPQP
jgi:hypothetical protein